MRASHAVSVFMGSGSSWEHDWVPSVGKERHRNQLLHLQPSNSGSSADVNVFAYEDNTTVTITDITTNTVSASGKAVANLASRTVLLRTVMQQGEDLNVRQLGLGLDALQAGHSYAVRATRPVTVQTGHLGAISGGQSGSRWRRLCPQSTEARSARCSFWASRTSWDWPAKKSCALSLSQRGDGLALGQQLWIDRLDFHCPKLGRGRRSPGLRRGQQRQLPGL